ncbi:MAG: hypothetical protein D3903_18430, partial [Candidatus Electrothrix sp. GM3_4]|nr:hypothetical protein [Candidatus Electrothrix sp. GM3_4]
MNRVNEAVKKEIKYLDSVCHDWAAWDGSCEFMETGSTEYEDGNLSVESFVTANLNLIYYVKPKGEVYWGKIYDLIDEKEIQLKAFSAENFSKTYKAIRWVHGSFGSPADLYKRGILLTEKGPLMLAARPIITSENKGPLRGTIIMGRFLNESVLNRLRKETEVNFNLHVCDQELSSGLQQVAEQIISSAKHIVKKQKDNLFIYDSFPSIQDVPAFLTEVIFP